MDKNNNPNSDSFNNNENQDNDFRQNYYGYQASGDGNQNTNNINNNNSVDKGQDRYLYRENTNENVRYPYPDNQNSNGNNRQYSSQSQGQVNYNQQNFNPNYNQQNFNPNYNSQGNMNAGYSGQTNSNNEYRGYSNNQGYSNNVNPQNTNYYQERNRREFNNLNRDNYNNYNRDSSNYNGSNYPNQKRKKNILLPIIGVLALILIGFLAFKFLFKGTRTISAKQAFSKVTFEGTDGKGYMIPELDEKYEENFYGLSKDDAEDLKNVDWLKDPNAAEEKIKEKLKNYEDWESFLKTFETKIDGGKNGELKNGEKLKIYFTADKEKAKKVGLKISDEPFEVTVEGLKEIREVSVIDSIKVNFKGENGAGLASYEITGDAKKWADNGEFYVTINPLYGVKNGDKVKLTISPMNFVANENGRQIKAESKEIEVSGLNEIADFRKNNQSGKVNLETLILNINKSMPKLVEKLYLNSYYWADKALVKGDGWTNQCNYQATDVYLAYDDQNISKNIFKTILKIDTSGTITSAAKNSQYKKNDKIKTTKFVIFSGDNLKIKEDGSLIGGNLKIVGIFDSRMEAQSEVIKTKIPQGYKTQSLNS